ncbi:hypothetical protein E2C01_039851 [Portunus trituberculatus]|uniref:Uncharacterized protein n=1 Tax=Portunus trituberculatus TaxID=210409 RepID=A0A5B7FI25_PORTR|nr:hypothetical protein [Portunus trituberculatus]
MDGDRGSPGRPQTPLRLPRVPDWPSRRHTHSHSSPGPASAQTHLGLGFRQPRWLLYLSDILTGRNKRIRNPVLASSFAAVSQHQGPSNTTMMKWSGRYYLIVSAYDAACVTAPLVKCTLIK